MADDNGKLMHILTEIQKDVRKTRDDLNGHCLKTSAILSKHDEQIRANAARLRWLYGIIGGIISGVVLLFIRGAI